VPRTIADDRQLLRREPVPSDLSTFFDENLPVIYSDRATGKLQRGAT
jgi:hypothetical protein